ncbi:MAG TPA: ATP-binding protein [Candidatus Nanoarchaeia archaeon]|nr:ATP-binding protein [Candidatus Nanoarchaeia archaeon]
MAKKHIFRKIFFGFFVLSLLFSIGALYSYLSLNAASEGLSKAFRITQGSHELSENVNFIYNLGRIYLLANNPSDLNRIKERYLDAISTTDSSIQKLTDENVEQYSLLVIQNNIKIAKEKSSALIQLHDLELSKNTSPSLAYDKELAMIALEDNLLKTEEALNKIENFAYANFEQSLSNLRRILFIFLVISLALIILSSLIAIIISESISKPINLLRDITDKISIGAFQEKIEIKTNDEIEDLANAFNIMAAKIKNSLDTISSINEGLEIKVKEKTDELNEKIKELETNKSAIMNILDDSDEANRQLVEAQESLKQNIHELKKLDQQKDQFISIAAHELKTPLTSIMGFSDLLKKESIAGNAELRTKYLLTIFKDSKRLAELITNILDLSRMDIGTLKMALEQVSVYDLVKETKWQMDIIIKNKGLDSEWKIEESIPSVTIDKNKIIQVISNLINNAVHYTEKGKITIQAKKENNYALFSVSDTGAGIPKESQQKIFTRFYQVDSPLTRKIGGTGLGLSLSKGFVEAMGGKIWFESEEGKGTTFYFTIPLYGAQAKKEVDIMQDIKKQGFAPVDDSTKKKIVEEYLATQEAKPEDGQKASSENQKAKKNPETQASKGKTTKKIDVEYLQKKGYIFKLPGLEGKDLPAADIKSKEIIESTIKNLKDVLGAGVYKKLEIPGLKIAPDGSVEIQGNEIDILESLVYMSEKFLDTVTTDILKKEIHRISGSAQWQKPETEPHTIPKEKKESEEKANKFFGV